MGVLDQRITAAEPPGVTFDVFLDMQGIELDQVPLDGVRVIYDPDSKSFFFEVTTYRLNELGRSFLNDRGEVATEVRLIPMPNLAVHRRVGKAPG